MDALVIGGTGPTGHFIVNGLRERGYRVTILHTGSHEIPEIPDDVVHLHTNPWDEGCLREAFAARTYDLCVATYGRLRRIAELSVGRVGRFVSVGGVAAYRGFMSPEVFEPHGLPVPTAEDAPLSSNDAEDSKGVRVVHTENVVFEHHPRATHFRYPYVYGPYQLSPREWCIVRRILDDRPHIVLPEDGLTLQAYGFAGNLAHALLLAVDQPDASAGAIYNCTDLERLSLRQVVEVIAAELGHAWEIVSMPYALAVPARPMLALPLATHRVLDLYRLRRDLGYRDAVPPKEALARTARWLVENPPKPGGPEETALTDPFDYAAEDALIASWKRLLRELPAIEWKNEPGYTRSYSGPGGRPRSSAKFEL